MVSIAKTSIYYGGVAEDVRKQIGVLTGYSEEQFPFRYLGVTLNPEKLQLINSILFGLENYWCSDLLLPKVVVNLINKLCKDYFWGTQPGKHKMIFQRWHSICSPWQEGGFNINELLSWNKALICKWLWLLSQNRDGIWDKLTKDYNMLDASIWTAQCKPHHAESWRAILKVRDSLLGLVGDQVAVQDVLDSSVLKGRFVISKVYDKLRQKHSKLGWARVLSYPEILPKHKISLIQAAQQVLSTVDKISARGYHLVNRCCLCEGALESHRHLFFRCPFSQAVRRLMLHWLGLTGSWSALALKNWLYRLLPQHGMLSWRCALVFSCLAGLVFTLWEERNNLIFLGRAKKPELLATELQWVLKIRLSASNNPHIRSWLVNK
ncbi:uncharacterized protein LOC141641408 [Silene latifolia]|uniref:uncharacterized protein LOC141641408 n=1 Tax=Silene latifolia TaxID=37657 RepID=UPI003D77E490